MPNPLIVVSLGAIEESDILVQRVQILDEKTMLLHVPQGSRLQYLIEEASRRGETLKVAVVLGAPVSIYPSAYLSWISFTEKMLFAGVISETKIATIRLEENLYVPFPSQMIIVGEIVPGEEQPEGKMLYENGDVIGGTPMPVIHAKKILTENNPIIYYSTIHPIHSDTVELYKLVSKLFLLSYKSLLPNIIDLTFLGYDAFRTVIAKVNTSSREKLINTGINLLSFSKILNPYIDTVILVGRETNIQDTSHVLKALLENVDPDKDIISISSQEYESIPRRNRKENLIIFATRQREADKVSSTESYPEPTPRSQKILSDVLNKLVQQ